MARSVRMLSKVLLMLLAGGASTHLVAQTDGTLERFSTTLIKHATIRYPVAAEEAGIEGKVWVELIVDSTCAIRSERVIKGLGFGLDEVALDLLDRRFQDDLITALFPCSRDTLVIPVVFKLQ